MDSSNIHTFRASKVSRLPGPAIHTGLKELSDSQSNARLQSSIPAPPGLKPGLKREIPQPAQQPDAKRKPIYDRAADYPAPPSASVAPLSKLAVKGQSLAQLKNVKHATNPPAASLSNFAKSCGPGKQPTERAHPPPSRSNHTRDKSHVGRPRTAHGHRPEEYFDESTSSLGMMPNPNNNLENIKVKHMRSTPTLLRNRESSLSARFNSLTLNNDDATSNDRCRVTSLQQAETTTSPSEHEIPRNVTSRVTRSTKSTHGSMTRDI